MAEMTRSPDFLRITASTTRRVRNLETGVHPTGTELRYYDSFGPTAVVITNPRFQHMAGGQGWVWLRRIGIVAMGGAIQGDPNNRPIADFGAEEVVARLPVEARPLVGISGIVAMTNAPFYARITVDADGYVTVYRAADWGGLNYPQIHFEGPTWAVN